MKIITTVIISCLLKGECLRGCGRLRSGTAAGPGCGSWQRPGSRSVALQRGLEGSLHPLHAARSSCRAFLQRQRGLSEDCTCGSRVPRCKGKATLLSKLITNVVMSLMASCSIKLTIFLLPAVCGRERCPHWSEARNIP